jgi:hypothetical protein
VTGGYGQWKQADHVTAAATEDGSLAVAYLPHGGTIQVAMNRLRRPVRATWFDPAGGQYEPVAGSPFGNKGSRDFTSPGRNAAGDADFVLVLEAP